MKNLTKKKITIAALMAALGVAVFLNWQFAKTDGEFTIADAANAESETEEYYGEAELVLKNDSDDSKKYFAEARLKREESRDNALDAAEDVLAGSKLSEVEKKAALDKLMQITRYTVLEAEMENLIIAKGFSDCMVYLGEDRATIIVANSTASLSKSETSQIKEIVLSASDNEVQNISIVAVK